MYFFFFWLCCSHSEVLAPGAESSFFVTGLAAISLIKISITRVARAEFLSWHGAKGL